MTRRRSDIAPEPETPPPPEAEAAPTSLEEKLRRARRRIKNLEQQTESPESRWTRQRKALVGKRTTPLIDLPYFPSGNWNAYFRLLYARCPEFGFDPRPLDGVAEVDDLSPASLLHLHGTRAAQVGASTTTEATTKTREFIFPIERFVERGGVLVWSIHDTLPHDCRFPDVEVGLRRRLAALARGIHVLHESTVEAVRPHYPLDPAKVFTVEHPLYTGAYPDYVTRAAARGALDLPSEAVMLLAFGAIRPYKGFDRLVQLLPRIRRESGREVRVMIAGRALATDDTRGLRHLVRATPGASMTEDGPPEEAVPQLFRAADVVVLPYREFLNSGVLLLGLTFGVPVVVPRTPVSASAAASGLVRFFEADSDENLIEATVAAIAALGPERPTLDPDFKQRHDPHHLAGVFAGHLQQLVAPDRE